jgi:hypothetical protein
MRSTVCCKEQHTPLSPAKNIIRSDWIKEVRSYMDIITISHGALDVLSILGWEGSIQVCDTDPGVRETTKYLRKDYPHLDILMPGNSIQETVQKYCRRHGIGGLGAVDVDLAGDIISGWEVLCPVITTLVLYRNRTDDSRLLGKTKILLTFRNGRDNFGKNAIRRRIAWLQEKVAKLTKAVRYVSHTEYSSGRIRENASRTKGSSMCIVEFELL